MPTGKVIIYKGIPYFSGEKITVPTRVSQLANDAGYLTTHQDISGKADKSATVSTVTWSNNKLTKTINGTTSDVVSAATILGNLTSSQVTTALGYVPGPSYIFESSDGSINISDSMVPGRETIDLTLNGLYSGAYKVDKAGDTIYGDLSFAGSDVRLQTSGSSSNDSGDIVFYYGNGNEKSRIWTDTGYTTTMGPNYRVYKEDGTALYTGRLATLSDLSWGNISGKPSSYTPTAHDHTYLNSAGTNTQSTSSTAFATGALNVRWFTATGKIPGQPSQYGFLLTLATGTGSGENHQIFMTQANGSLYHRGTNASSAASPPAFSTILDSSNFTTWAAKASHSHSYLPLTGGTVSGATTFSASGIAVTINADFYCKSKVRTTYVCRPDDSDSGYVNHVNTSNNAYRPIRASAFTNMSCKYTKENIVDISEEDALKLLDIRPVNFDYIEEVGGQKDQIGVLAEDTYKVLPKVVSVPDDYVEEDFDISKGIHQPLPSVDYAKFVPYLIKLVQIQQKEIDILKKERT